MLFRSQTASYVVTAQTASFVTTAQTASYVKTAQTASYVNSLNQNVIITGSTSGPSLDILSNFSTTGYPLSVKNSGYFHAYFQGTSANNQVSYYMDNDRGGFASYGGFLIGGSTSTLGSLFGVARADRLFMFADGASNLGFYVGTLQSQPFVIGTNNAERIRVLSDGTSHFLNNVSIKIGRAHV